MIVLLRKLRLISHSVAKQRVMALEVSDEEIDRFVDFLTGYTRRELLESYQNGDNMIVLATAAPDILCNPLCKQTWYQLCVCNN